MYLNLEKAQELIANAIADKGEDYIYPNAEGGNGTCKYVDREYDNDWGSDHTKVKGCIIGNALITALNLDMEALDGLYVNEESANAFLDYLVDEKLLSGVGEGVRLYFANLQTSQDRGRPWGEANENAKLGKMWVTWKDTYVENAIS